MLIAKEPAPSASTFWPPCDCTRESQLARTALGTVTPLYLERSLSEIGSVPAAPRPAKPNDMNGFSGMPSPAGFQFTALKPRASAVALSPSATDAALGLTSW